MNTRNRWQGGLVGMFIGVGRGIYLCISMYVYIRRRTEKNNCEHKRRACMGRGWNLVLCFKSLLGKGSE